MATKDKASIYVDLQVLFAQLYDAQWEMAKCNRVVLGDKMLEHCEKAIAYFNVAFDIESKRDEYIALLCEEFSILKFECRFAIDRFFKSDTTKNKIRESIVKIQEGLDKWLSSFNSYVGLMKNRNEFKNIQRLYAILSKSWKKYLYFDYDRMCLSAKQGYKHNDIIKYKFDK